MALAGLGAQASGSSRARTTTLHSISSASPSVHLLRSGPYTVRMVPGGPLAPRRGMVEITRLGRLLRTLREWSLDAKIIHPPVTGAPLLFVTTFSGGAHCCFTAYVFELGPRLRTLLAFNAGNYGEKMEFSDLDGDGRLEIIAWDDSFAYYASSFAASPALPFVFRYSQGRYRNATAHYPQLVKADREKAKQKLLEAVKRRPHPPQLDWDDEWHQNVWREDDIRSATINVYGDALITGEPRRARRWLKERLPAENWRWFVGARHDIERTVAERDAKISYAVRPRWRKPYWERVRPAELS